MNRTLATSLTLAGLAVAYHVAFGRRHLREIDELHREMDACYASFDQAEIEATQVNTLKQSVQDLEQWKDELQRRLTHDPLAVPTVAATRSTVESFGLSVNAVEPMTADGSLSLPHQRTRIVATGEFAQVWSAIHVLENEASPARVTDLSVQATTESSRVRAEFTLVRFWSIER